MHKYLNYKLSYTFLLIIFISSACVNNEHWTDIKSIDGGKWSLNDTLKFHTNISDTTAKYNLFVTIRNGGEYAYSNLFLFIHAEAPNKGQFEEKFEAELADKSGKWHGDGFGSKFYLEYPYKRDVRFATSGIYSFKIVHGMREEPLNGIFDIGLKIEKAQ